LLKQFQQYKKNIPPCVMILLPVTRVTPNIFGDSPGLEHVEDATFV